MTLTQTNPANQTNLRKLDKFLGLVLIASALLVALYFTTKANLDLTEGRYALFMDERITFDGVKELLHPKSFLAFIDTVIDGKDHRYGRILWNISALFAFLPEKLWGASGQIVAIRFTQAVIQLLAYGLLVFTLIRSWILRGLALLLLVALPYTAYFATMPKPEPIQLLCLALFLAFSAKNQFRFGYYWVFLGLAFGAKISTLTLLPLFILLGLAAQVSQVDWVDLPIPENKRELLKRLFRAGLIFLGIYQLIHAVTILLEGSNAYSVQAILGNAEKVVRRFPQLSGVSNLPESVIIYPYTVILILVGLTLILIPTISHYLESKSLSRVHVWLKVMGSFLLGFLIAVPVVFFKFPLGSIKWLFATLLNTSHGSDDTSITVYSWVRYSFSDYAPVPSTLLISLFLAIIVIFILTLAGLFKDLQLRGSRRDALDLLIRRSYPFILLLVSLFSVVPVFLSVDRLWGHYLHLGTVFFVVAIFLASEQLLTSKVQTPLPHSWVVALVVSVLSVQTLITVLYMMPAMATEMNSHAQRTTTPEFQQKKAEYDYLLNLFQTKASAQNRPLNIYVDADFFIPDSTQDWEVIEIFGYFQDWQAEPDLVVLYRQNSPLSHQPLNTSAMHKPWLTAKEAMVKHLSTADQTCAVKPCYLELSSPHPELLILAKQS